MISFCPFKMKYAAVLKGSTEKPLSKKTAGSAKAAAAEERA
jgi:hypothetical protein